MKKIICFFFISLFLVLNVQALESDKNEESSLNEIEVRQDNDVDEKIRKINENLINQYKKYLDSINTFNYTLTQDLNGATFKYGKDTIMTFECSNEELSIVASDSSKNLTLSYKYDGTDLIYEYKINSIPGIEYWIFDMIMNKLLLNAVAEYKMISIENIHFFEPENTKFGDYEKNGFEFLFKTYEETTNTGELKVVTYPVFIKINIDRFNINDLGQGEEEKNEDVENKEEKEEIENPQTGQFVSTLLLTIGLFLVLAIAVVVKRRNVLFKI